MANKKIYTIVSHTSFGYNRPDRDMEFSGTVDELRDKFGYTLEIGHSWNNKINMYPKTINALINAINKSYDEKNACRYTCEYVYLKTA